MKNKASKFLKDLITILVTIVKNKSMAVKSKTAGFKTRFLLLGIIGNKKVLMATISHKMQVLIANERDQQNYNDAGGSSAAFESYNGARAIVPRKAPKEETFKANYVEPLDFGYFEEDEEHEYPDMTPSQFELESEEGEELEECDELELVSSSAIDFVKSCRNCDESNFNLEEEIDNVADVFIRRHHEQMMLQKQDSFNRRCREMLQGDA